MSGPQDPILLPRAAIAAGREIHHEAELVAVIGHGGVNIDVQSAAAHVLGYTIGIDVTVRGDGDRSRRKSYDTFSPLGPWITTADEVPDPHDLDIQLRVGDQLRHNANTSTMDKSIPEIIAYASQSTNLRPGDLIFTGSPPGVGPITAGDGLDVTISGLGEMHLDVGG
jgi:2-keto-4-pentenoate hydratase/2-oxohepta-3-ene-1,7-dioic acid hydratase in catechol pathway